MKIGEVAKRAAVSPSAIRYYESVALLPATARIGGKRYYSSDILTRLKIIQLAKDTGFTIREIQTLISHLAKPEKGEKSWKKLAEKKWDEIEQSIASYRKMQVLLKKLISCGCVKIDLCELVNAEKK